MNRTVETVLSIIVIGGGVVIGSAAGAMLAAQDQREVIIRHEFVTPPYLDPGTPSYDDERWQDPSGLPYCDPSSPLYPCLNVNPFSVDGGPEQTWEPVSQEFADALAEGDDTPPENATTRDWQACWAHVTEHTYTVVCPDGYVAHA